MSTDEPGLVSTIDRPGRFDAIETAKPGEPLFAVQGGDEFGPDTVLHWVSLARAAGLARDDPKLLVKASAAEDVAWAMRAYQRDEPTASQTARRATYSGAAPVAGDDRNVILARAADRLYNIVAEIGDMRALLGRVDGINIGLELSALAGYARQAAAAIEPRRHLQRLKSDG